MKDLDYKCKECGTIQIVKMGSMLDVRPKEVNCIIEGCEGVATFDFNQLKSSSTIMPEHMKAGSEPSMKYNKISRGMKKFN